MLLVRTYWGTELVNALSHFLGLLPVAYKELFVIAGHVWGHHLSRNRNLFRSDNEMLIPSQFGERVVNYG